MASWQNDQLTKWSVDKMTLHNDSIFNKFITVCIKLELINLNCFIWQEASNFFCNGHFLNNILYQCFNTLCFVKIGKLINKSHWSEIKGMTFLGSALINSF